MQRIGVLFVLIVGLVVLTGCGGDNPADSGGTIVDDWEKLNVVLTFFEDGTFTAMAEGSSGAANGTYVITGNEITFVDDQCGTDQGKYTFVLSGNTLTFALVSDDCDRADVVPGVWSRR